MLVTLVPQHDRSIAFHWGSSVKILQPPRVSPRPAASARNSVTTHGEVTEPRSSWQLWLLRAGGGVFTELPLQNGECCSPRERRSSPAVPSHHRQREATSWDSTNILCPLPSFRNYLIRSSRDRFKSKLISASWQQYNTLNPSESIHELQKDIDTSFVRQPLILLQVSLPSLTQRSPNVM